MTFDTTLPTIDAAELAEVQSRVAAFIPPRVRQDWPRLDFSRDSAQGVVTEALGMQLSSVFQTIHTPDGAVAGEEAFLRAKSHGVQIPPASVFRITAAQEQLVAFDRLCRTLHLLNYLAGCQPPGRLYLNVHPRLLSEVSVHGVVFDEILQSVHWSSSHITLEFPESKLALCDPQRAKEAIRNYRARGFAIGIDNFGEQSVRLDTVWELAPDVVKLDRQLLVRSESGSTRRKELALLVRLLRDSGVKVVMQGVETPEQYRIAVDAGVDLLQGYYWGMPRVLQGN